jgi:hypothetical protein
MLKVPPVVYGCDNGVVMALPSWNLSRLRFFFV